MGRGEADASDGTPVRISALLADLEGPDAADSEYRAKLKSHTGHKHQAKIEIAARYEFEPHGEEEL